MWKLQEQLNGTLRDGVREVCPVALAMLARPLCAGQYHSP